MRDYKRIDGYLDKLAKHIYPQPEGDDEHGVLAKRVINYWMSMLPSCTSVLDVGCGEGFCQPLFEYWNVAYEGVAMGQDVKNAVEKERNVKKMDFTFLDYPERAFDMVFSRHSLEHSPFPLLTLMEWERVAVGWLGVVLPAPEWYTYRGLNHYSVMNVEQAENLLDLSGWRTMDIVVDYKDFVEGDHNSLKAHELWLLAERKGI